jgi:hypothetical protein
MSASQQNRSSRWVLAIPLPLYLPLGRRRCMIPGCGRTFWTRNGYRGHYALAHILELD